MLKFIKMKYHDAYLLYYSVLFVVIVVFTVIENVSASWSQRWNKIENSSGMHFFMFECDIKLGNGGWPVSFHSNQFPSKSIFRLFVLFC